MQKSQKTSNLAKTINKELTKVTNILSKMGIKENPKTVDINKEKNTDSEEKKRRVTIFIIIKSYVIKF